ncbi:LOW QUALITY PROTEIN: A-kinase anchor protein 12 [Sceloporus undulatus]|uniref:LOW QUALITY PROTEIN: A-kinase anchor protein 12 n=1 Tax=Sceloporus undulatus TaxID=8520 RepID=UPI001C4D0E19|nr:LOW QUALITY PROTEIN: A-kinase anchor protein 12 [Sceloporus undulatus]
MGAGSSAEQRSPQDAAPEESQPSSPEGQPASGEVAAEAAQREQPEEPAKLLQKNGQISSINGITEEQVDLSLKPEELNGQQAEVIITDVGERETASVILKEESFENMEGKPPESTNKTNGDDDQKDVQDADKQSPSLEEKGEEQEQPSESPSNDVGFKKVFKLVGFKFTVRKDKTEKVEPVQLLNVKADDTEVASDGSGDHKEFKKETMEEAAQIEVPHSLEKTEQETQTEKMKEETSLEKERESPIEAGGKDAETKNDDSNSPESPTSPLTNETASPLRKFFTQGWAGFRKRTSFRKPKEEEQQALDKEKQEQERDVTKEEGVIKEELEEENPIPEKAQTDVEANNEKVEENREEKEGKKMIDVSTETHQKEVTIPHEQLSRQDSAEGADKKIEISLNEKSNLVLEEKSEPSQECLIALKQSTLESSQKKLDPAAPSENELKIDQSDPAPLITTEEPKEHFETVEEGKSEPKAPLATESFDEKLADANMDFTTIVKKDEPKTIQKEQLVLEQLTEIDTEIQRRQSTDEQLKLKETVPETVSEQLKQTEPGVLSAATSKPPEGITNEVELISSQERAKMQGSPLKKLFTSSSLKKLSVKKHKGKREETKSGEAAEQIQQLSDSAESPEDPRAESSASSPEEATESVEKVTEGIQVTETEEGSTSDIEKKRESVTPWASFKKMVTPKKRIRRLSESDKEEEPDKAKSATLSSTESAPCEEQEDIKENGEEQKLEKNTDEPKKKVDTSVSWEALICVGSSKKRSRKSSSSDEEVGQRLAQEGQKVDETAPNKETAGEMTFTSSQESDQGQGGSSPEQVGSPSEGEGVSTWESFKRLVTARRKSKTKMEDRSEEPAVVPSLEYSTSDGESGKEESWVSFKKLMPGRRKKKSDGIPEHAPVQETGEEITETNEEDSDIPAVVPLSEYEAAEQEKLEAQKKNQEDITVKGSDQRTEKSEGTLITEQSSEGLVHAVTVTVVEGERAVTSIEERSPSWISAAVTETVEHAGEDEEKQTKHISETGLVEETVVATKLKPEIKKDVSGDTIISELELTSEAITAREEASAVEEGPEVSCAEETTEMVSAVSRLSESPDTTEIATPVQEVEENQQNLEELSKQTQEILQEVAERVKLSEETKMISKTTSEVIIQPVSVQKTDQEITVVFQGAELSESLLKEKTSEKTDIQTNEGIERGQGQVEVKESSLKEVLEKSHDVCVEVKQSPEETTSLNQTDEDHHLKTEHEALEKPREIAEEQAIEEKSEEEEDFVIVTVTPEETPEITIDDAAGKQLESLKEKDSKEYSKAYSVQEVKMHLEEGTQGKIKEDVQELKKETCEETPGFFQKQEEVEHICQSEAETTEIEENKPVKQNEVKDSELLIKTSYTDSVVHEVPIQIKSIDVSVQDDESKVSDMSMENDAALGLETGSTQEVTVEAGMQNKFLIEHVKTETHIQKMDPEVHLQELETKMPLVDVKPEPLLMNLETQIHAEMVGKEISVRKMDAGKEKVEAEDHTQKVETSDHIEEMEGKSHIMNVREDVLAEKSELNVGIDISTEKTKTESITEKADVDEHLKKREAHISPEDAHSKLSVESDVGKMEEEMPQPMTEVKSEALTEKMEVEDLTEKLKVAATSEKEDVTVHVEATTGRIDAKIESEICTDKTDAKVNGESSTEKADAMVEGETVIPSMLTDQNMKEEPPSARVDMEPLVEKVGAEIAKEKTEMEIVKDMGHSSDKAKAEDEKTAKTDVVAMIENAGAKADLELFAGETLEKVCEEYSEEMMEAGAATKQPELKETLQKVENEAIIQSVVKDTATAYLTTCAEIISVEAPVDLVSEQKSVISDMTRVAIQGETQSVATEKSITQEQRPLEVSTSSQDKVDLTQMVIADASLVVESEITDVIEAEAQENNELKDITVMKSKSTKESIAETSVQTGRVMPAVEEEKIVTSLGTTALEGTVQSEKEDAFTSESKHMDVNVVEDSVQNEATGDSVKEKLATETESVGILINKAEVDGGILTLESGYKESLASNAILENIRDSTPPDDKEESINGISVQIHTCPGELLLETVHPLSESTTASDSYQRRQVLSEKVQIIETQKSSENIELGGGDVLPEALVEQEIFAEQQEVVTRDIPEVQSYAVHKSSITVTATEAEEQVSTEKITLTGTSAETPQSLLQEIEETAFQMVQQVSFVHPGLDTKAVSEKTKIEAEEPILPAASFTKDDTLPKSGSDLIPEMKLQKSETDQEAEKQMTSPARSPSLTHIEFDKDVVQSVTIESQSTKIVLKIIQNAVDKMEKTEEPVFSSQQTEPCPLHADKSEIQEDLQKQEAFKATEDMPLTTEKSENGKSSGTKTTAADLEAVKHTPQTDEQSHALTKLVQVSGSKSEAEKEIIKEESLQKENGEPKLQTVVDTVVPTETQRVTLEGAVSGSLPKKSLEADQPKLKDVDVEQIQEQLIEQQMPVKRKEDHSPSTGFVEIQPEKDVNNQDFTSHEIPQLKSELTES